MTDETMLRSLLRDERLGDDEREKFQDMLDGLPKFKKLSAKQHDWVRSRFEQLELDAEEGSMNLVSAGKIPRGRDVRMGFEDMPKPKSPPGRRTL